MTISSIADHAQSCLDRDYLVRWFPDNIQIDEEKFGFSETELAVVEETLQSLNHRNSLLIHNPLPCNRIPIAICLAYARTQDPRFPTNGIVGRGDSMLVLPALSKGYLSTIDEAKLDGIGKTPKLIERRPIGAVSEANGNADLYTAKHNFEFDQRIPRNNDISAVFVDLRKPEWGRRSRRFSEIRAELEKTNLPVIYYTDEITDEATVLQQEVNTVEITSELLMTAHGMSVPNPGETARFGHLLTEDEFSVQYISVGHPQMKSIVKDLVQMKNDLQERRIANIEVGWLFNLLTKLPIRPQHWDDATGSNYYQQGVRELLENLRNKAQRLSGSEADLLINYCHAADHLHGLLNREHPLQEALFDLIQEAEENEIDRAFIVRGEYEREAILRAITVDDGPSPSSASIRELSNARAGEFDEVVLCRPLDYDSYAYEFPLSQRITFLQFDSWTDVVKRRVDRGLDVLNTDIEMKKVGQFEEHRPTQSTTSPTENPQPADRNDSVAENRTFKEPTFDTMEPVDDYVPDVDGASEEAVIETLEQEFKQSSNPTERSGGSNGGSSPDLQFELENGEVRTTSQHSRVTILRNNGDIGRIPAADLAEGDTVVLVESAADDIYDIFVESAHEKEKLRKCESVVNRWKETLEQGLEEQSSADFLKELRERGSEITDPGTIELWANGSAIGPRDPEDVRRVFEVLDPEMAPTWEATVQAMKDIRTEHRQIGKQARESIESTMSPSMASELSDSLDEGIDQDAVRKATVKNITEI